MTNWGKGGLSGSLIRWVRKEVREQLRSNPLARRARYTIAVRLLRRIFSIGSFWKFLGLYLLVDLVALALEGFWACLAPAGLGAAADGVSTADLLKNVPGYLIGAQVGLLSVISLALALVTLIAQRDDAHTDVQVYYHESLFFEITASCLALTAVLCGQLIWPLQLAFHQFGGSGHPQLFKIGLLVFHLGWFLVNLAAVAHFIGITFLFVQRRARERMRESYTANVIVPIEMTERVLETVYSMAGTETILVEGDAINPVCFGLEMPEPYAAELRSHFRRSMRITNVHVRIAHWAIRRWHHRCAQPETGREAGATADDRRSPCLWFLPRPGQPLRGDVAWCRRKGGVPLDWIERSALRLAFRFGRAGNAD